MPPETCPLRFGYNTNGLAHHAPDAALELLAELGYAAVGITLDHGWLDPYAANHAREMESWRRSLARYGFRSVIETGARFLLNPSEKHEPTLVTADASERAARVAFYQRAIDVAVALGSDCVSLWSGILRDPCDQETAWTRLSEGLNHVLDYAALRNMPLGFEPEPGMFIDTMARFDELTRRVDSSLLKLTLDIGHLHCQGETPIADVITRYASKLVNVHIEDMRAGVHEHLQFGDGQIEFRPVLAALGRAGYRNGVYVELSRHSHCAPDAARHAIRFLREAAR